MRANYVNSHAFSPPPPTTLHDLLWGRQKTIKPQTNSPRTPAEPKQIDTVFIILQQQRFSSTPGLATTATSWAATERTGWVVRASPNQTARQPGCNKPKAYHKNRLGPAGMGENMTGIYAHYACGMLIIKRAINMKNCLNFLQQTAS